MKRTLVVGFVFILAVCSGWAQAPQGAQGGPQGAPAQGGQAAAPAARGGRGGGGGGNVTARILSFQATPVSIKPGESFVLAWSTESGTGTIDNGIGAVPTRGTIKITPKATTTYTISLGGGAVTRSVTVTVAGTTPVTAAADQPAQPKPRALIDGKPNFSGVYGGVGGARGGATPQAAPSPYASLPAQAPLKAGFQNRGGPANPAGGTADCMPLPADTAFGVPYPWQLIQSKDYIVFFFEYPGTFRIVPLDGAPHQADPDPTWLGESIGHWEGDTLVIDTVAFNGKHAIGGIQKPSESFHTIERLQSLSATQFSYEIIFEDPEAATGPWRQSRVFSADTRPGVNKVMEFVCENNRDYIPLFGPEGPPAAGGQRGGGQRGGAQPAQPNRGGAQQ